MYCFSKMPHVRIFVVKQISRHFGISNVKLKMSRQSKYINKFIRQGQLSSRDPLDFSNSEIFGPLKKKVSAHAKRRVNVLNTVFMKHITDLLSTGEIEPEFLNRGIEISHVEVTYNFKNLNVFWIDNDIDNKSDTVELLQNCAYKLRHELSQLYVIGHVPPIQFVKCKSADDVKEVERRLNSLDFEDHTPSSYPNILTCTVTSKISIDKENKGDKKSNSEGIENVFRVTLPQMRHDVFELDHLRIMLKIKLSLNKSRNNLKKELADIPFASTPVSELDFENTSNTSITTEDQEQFQKFLIQKRREQKYRNKQKHCEGDIVYDVSGERDDDDDDCNIDDDLNDDTYMDDYEDHVNNYYEDSIHRKSDDKY